MTIRKSVLVAGAVAAVGITSVAGVGLASAQTSSSSTGASGLIEKLATKFNLKQDDVKQVFEEEKAARKADMQAEIDKKLQNLVDSGKITAEQKTLIENKQKELQAAHETERTELEQWATDNGIEAKYLMVGIGHRGEGADDRLQTALDNKELTAEQKSKIEAKQKELETKRTDARDAIKKWADDNNIDAKYLKVFGGPGKGHGGHDGIDMM